MKRLIQYKVNLLIILLVLILSILSFGCSSYSINTEKIYPPYANENSGNNDGNGGQDDSEDDNQASKLNVKWYVKSKVDGLTIRSSPTTFSESMGSINKNDMVLLEDTEKGWYKTKYKGKTAYLSSNNSYTQLVSMQTGSDEIEKTIDVGSKFLGTKYVYGATRLHNGSGRLLSGFTDKAFDCSSYVQYMFYYGAKINLDLTTRTQVKQGKYIQGTKNLKRGDLMFFTNASRLNKSGYERIGHVAVFLGDNYILHTASDYAVIEPISSTRWSYLLYIRRHL